MPKEGFWNKNGTFNLGRLFMFWFILELGIFAVVSSMNASNPQLLSEFQNQQSSILSKSFVGIFLSIFPNNLTIAGLEFIPVYGIYLFLYSSYITSLVIALEGTAGLPGFVIFISLILVPHTWLELPAYAISVSAGIFLVYALVKRGRSLWTNLLKVGYLLIFVTVELAVAALFETTEIYFELSYPALKAALYTFVLWIPGALALFGLAIWFRRIRRVGSQTAKEPEPAFEIPQP